MADRFTEADAPNRLANVIRLGVIATVDHASRRAQVEFEDDWISDDLPWLERRAGEVSTWSPPTVGEQVVVLCPGGEPTVGLILLGVPSDTFPAAGDRADLERLVAWEDFSDQMDAATGKRTIDLPSDGGLVVSLGGTAAIEVSTERLSLKMAGAELVLADGKITLTGEVFLGGAGGLAVARHGDSVVAGKVVATSAKVKAS
ncbi:MAG: phage baseplate assembly protein V [Alphaproteobacteria bacterium]|nr:MAG: phage baseplate assembly protein V [Alphaproteobacteria bacterium]